MSLHKITSTPQTSLKNRILLKYYDEFYSRPHTPVLKKKKKEQNKQASYPFKLIILKICCGIIILKIERKSFVGCADRMKAVKKRNERKV